MRLVCCIGEDCHSFLQITSVWLPCSVRNGGFLLERETLMTFFVLATYCFQLDPLSSLYLSSEDELPLVLLYVLE